MKRIVQCPKCEAKLAVFDLGKPINQKCPKCGNAFVIDSEKGVARPAETTQPPTKNQDMKSVVSDKEKPISSQNTPSPGKSAKNTNSAAKPETKPTEPAVPQKEITLKNPVTAPAAASLHTAKPAPYTLEEALPDTLPAQTGISFMHVIVIIGLLMLSIILQVMGKKAAEKYYVDLAERLVRIEAKLQTLDN